MNFYSTETVTIYKYILSAACSPNQYITAIIKFCDYKSNIYPKREENGNGKRCAAIYLGTRARIFVFLLACRIIIVIRYIYMYVYMFCVCVCVCVCVRTVLLLVFGNVSLAVLCSNVSVFKNV
jgi:hypothetical protein